MKKVLFLSLFAMVIATISVTARDDQNSVMDKITESVPTIKQTATFEMPFVVNAYNVQNIDVNFVTAENIFQPIKSQPIFQLVCSSESLVLDIATALITWQRNGDLFSNKSIKRIPNLGFNYIEVRSTEYLVC
jgi:hypothetical protein